jgi:uncharacterized membrane protein YhaH (DUF805 family)
MNFLKLFFGFSGRVGRTIYWCGNLASLLGLATFFFVVDTIFLGLGTSILMPGANKAPNLVELGLLSFAAAICVVSMLSLHVRRIRDRGLSGWFGFAGLALIYLSCYWVGRFLPGLFLAEGMRLYVLLLASPGLVGLIIVLLQFGMPRGQAGPNRFGPDPLEQEANSVT